MPLDQDYEHARYDPGQVEEYFAAATQAALALAAFRAPYRGRSTPVNAWWGSFDLCVVMFSGVPADPPSDDFITRNASDAQQVAAGWWPGDARSRAAFYAFAYPAPPLHVVVARFACGLAADQVPADRDKGRAAVRPRRRADRGPQSKPARTALAIPSASISAMTSAARAACWPFRSVPSDRKRVVR